MLSMEKLAITETHCHHVAIIDSTARVTNRAIHLSLLQVFCLCVIAPEAREHGSSINSCGGAHFLKFAPAQCIVVMRKDTKMQCARTKMQCADAVVCL